MIARSTLILEGVILLLCFICSNIWKRKLRKSFPNAKLKSSSEFDFFSYHIIVTYVRQSQSQLRDLLTKKGFIVNDFLDAKSDGESKNQNVNSECWHCAISLSPALQTKISVQNKMKVVAHDEYSYAEKYNIVCNAIKLIERSEIDFHNIILSQSTSDLNTIARRKDADSINSYYGKEIVSYFTWMRCFSLSLYPLGMVTVVTFILDVTMTQSIQSLTPLVAGAVALWSIVQLKLYKRYDNISNFKWGHLEGKSSLSPPPLHHMDLSDIFKVSYLTWAKILVVGYIVVYVNKKSAIFVAKPFLVHDPNAPSSLSTSHIPHLLATGFISFCISKLVIPHCRKISAANSTTFERHFHQAIAFALILCNRYGAPCYLLCATRNIKAFRELLLIIIGLDQMAIFSRNFKWSSELRDKVLNVYPSKVESKLGDVARIVGGAGAVRSDIREKAVLVSNIEYLRADSSAHCSETGSSQEKSKWRGGMKVMQKVKSVFGSLNSSTRIERGRGSSMDEEGNGNGNGSDEDDNAESQMDSSFFSAMPLPTQIDDNGLLAGAHTSSSNVDIAADVARPEEPDLLESHTSKLVVFSDSLCFCSICPILPLLGILRLIEISDYDILQLVLSQRNLSTQSVKSSSDFLSHWCTSLAVCTQLAIVLNCTIAFHVSPGELVTAWATSTFGEGAGGCTGSFLITVMASQLLLLLHRAVDHMVADIPMNEQNALQKYHEDKNQVEMEDRMHMYSFNHNRLDYISHYLKVQQSRAHRSSHASVDSDIALKYHISKEKLMALHQHCSWMLTPAFFILMTMSPYVLFVACNVPLEYSLAIVGLLYLYLWSEKTYRDEWTVVNMVSNPALMRVILAHLPGWVKDADKRDCEWLNDCIAQSWHKMAEYGRVKVLSKMDPMLEEIKPSMFRSLAVDKLTFGTLPPKIVSIRTIGKFEDPMKIQMEMEISWTSNFDMVIKASNDIDLIGVSIDIFDLKISGLLRVEVELCDDVVTSEPPVKLARFSFIDKPMVDISVAFGENVDKNIKLSQIGIAPLLRKTMRQALQMKALYPLFIQVPISKIYEFGGTMEDESHAQPHGVLSIQVVSCSSLPIADLTSSDPFVEINFMKDSFRTAIVFSNLNPTWDNEHFDLIVFDPLIQVVSIKVYDYDVGSDPDVLGNVDLPLAPLMTGISNKEFNLSLSSEDEKALKTKNYGRVKLIVSYHPLSNATINESDISRLLYSISPESLAGDTMDEKSLNMPHIDTKNKCVNVKDALEKRLRVHHQLPLSSSAGDNSAKGVLQISKLACHDLVISTTVSKTVSPYLIVSVNNLKRITRPSKQPVNPQYPDVYYFVIRDLTRDILRINLCRKNAIGAQIKMGVMSFRVIDLISKTGSEHLIRSKFLHIDKNKILVERGELTMDFQFLHISNIKDSNFVDSILAPLEGSHH